MTGVWKRISQSALVVAAASLLGVVVSGLLGASAIMAPAWITLFGALAIYFMGHSRLRSYAFTVWVFAFVAAALGYPVAFGSWFGFDLAKLIVPLIQIIMFGMGTTLNLSDFGRVMKMPVPILIGFVLQFSVMPLAGFAIATGFGFEPEVAAGVVLIGSCSGGVASNLMTYLAGGNVALSVTMTSCSTLVSPLMTPFLMKVLAGRMVNIVFMDMMMAIINLIIVPIVAGLLANQMLYGRRKVVERGGLLSAVAIIGIGLAILVGNLRGELLGPLATVQTGFVIGCALIGCVALVKIVVELLLRGPKHWMDHALPLVSMFGICFIIAIITARSSEKLLTVGLALIAAAILHNLTGYLLGYWVGWACRLEERSCRTIAFEVGMQNGGMASALAMDVLKSASAALAPAIFGPWMNVSGSMLATWWKGKPTVVHEEEQITISGSEVYNEST